MSVEPNTNSSAPQGGDYSAMQQSQGGQQPMGGQMDGQNFQGQDSNAILAQQQALMAMAGGAPAPGAPAGAGFDAGASREALMNLLSRQGFGGGMGAAGMGGMGGGMPGMQQGFGGMAGFQGQQLGNK